MAKKRTEQDLDNLIDSKLNHHLDCNTYPNVCKIMKTRSGRIRIFNRVKTVILKEGMTDIDEALTNIEAGIDD